MTRIVRTHYRYKRPPRKQATLMAFVASAALVYSQSVNAASFPTSEQLQAHTWCLGPTKRVALVMRFGFRPSGVMMTTIFNPTSLQELRSNTGIWSYENGRLDRNSTPGDRSGLSSRKIEFLQISADGKTLYRTFDLNDQRPVEKRGSYCECDDGPRLCKAEADE